MKQERQGRKMKSIRTFLNQIPYPITGVMLSFAVLGNLLGVLIHPAVKTLCGWVAAIILIVIALKIILTRETLTETMKTLPTASVMATLPMGIMVLSTYLLQFNYGVAYEMWLFGFVANVGIILYFIVIHLRPIKAERIFASYFVTFVGIVATSVTAKPYGMEVLGHGAFWFGLIAYVLWLPMVVNRYVKLPDVKEPLKPFVVIFAAPANLLVVGYNTLQLQWSPLFIYGLWVLGLMTTLYAWMQMVKQRNLPFYPSYAAYTFPLVIGAVATNTMAKRFANYELFTTIVTLLVYVQTIVAVAAVLYVSFMYIKQITKRTQ